ncbi:MAG: hypothetical protein MUE86_07130 [Thiobacillaceae bacterium]|jgi:hypothetical protein|nr:hypothetical protein [Thiobacillaceae bacterium]
MIRLSCWVGAKYGQVPQDTSASRPISLRSVFPLDVEGAEADRLGFPSAASALLMHFLEENDASASREVEDASVLITALPALAQRVGEVLDRLPGRMRAQQAREIPVH